MKLNLKRAEEILPGDLIVVDHELVQVTHFAFGRGQAYIKFIGVGDDLSLEQSVSCAAGYWFQCFDAGTRQSVSMREIQPGDILLMANFSTESMGWIQVKEIEYQFDSSISDFTFSLLRCKQSDGAEVELAREPDNRAHRIAIIDAIPPELKRMEDVEEGETIFVHKHKSLQLITGTICNKTQDEADTFFGFTEELQSIRHRIPRKAFAEVVLPQPLVKRNPVKGHLSVEMILDA